MVTTTWPVTISQQRDRWNDVSGHPGIRLRERWNAQHDYSRGRTVTHPATRTFIHISVTNPGSYRGNDAHAQAIEHIGRARFGFGPSHTGISYNFGIMHDGSLYEFQPVGRRGAHTVNDFRLSTCERWGNECPGHDQPLTAPSWNLNYNARAFVICQNVDDSVIDAMIDKLARAIVTCFEAGFITRHAAHHPHGHRCVSAKSCPGNRMWNRMWDLHELIHHYLDNGLEEDVPIDREDVETFAKTDGIYDGPASNPRVIDGTNKTWHFNSHVKYTTNQVLYVIPEMLRASEQTQGETLDLVQAIAESQLGNSADEIKAHITAKHEEAAAQRAAIVTKIDAMNTVIDQLAEGKLNAEQVAQAWRRIVHEATAPPSG